MLRRPNQRWSGWLCFLAILLFDPVRCTAPTTAASAAQFLPSIAISEGKSAQGYPYLSGGVGAEERTALEEKGKTFNVKLAFAETRGPYLADVAVTIAKAKGGEVLSLPSAGPWLYLQLPPGRYDVKATYRGQTKEFRSLEVKKDHTVRRTLAWSLAEE